jgi:hypothetical protein
MANAAGPMRRRLDASEALLTYETPPEVAEYTKGFLTSVIEDRERVTADTRLRASTLLRRFEAKRVAQQTIKSGSSDHWREVWRNVALGRRRVKLDKAGLWPPPRNWCDDILADDYEPLRPSEAPR